MKHWFYPMEKYTNPLIISGDESQSETEAKDIPAILLPFMGTRIIYPPRTKLSTYTPCALMMDYILHQINSNLVDNFYFNRITPDFHPYILRLYYGIIFWIQCLRAGSSVSALRPYDPQFLSRFLNAFPPESLPVVGPLVPLFKTLCSSQPEFSTYGKVYPILPTAPGPEQRSSFSRDAVDWHILPNVPGIIALLEHLNSVINAEKPMYPKIGTHIPVAANTDQDTVFGHHTFDASDKRTARDSWSLVSSGLQYPCEAHAKLNEAFSKRYEGFDFPVTYANDNLASIDSFLSMDRSLAWFSQVKSVAASSAAFFQGSETLADCEPYGGVVSNQIVVQLQAPGSMVTVPTCSADKNALFPFAFRLCSTARRLPPLSEAMAAMAQTNVEMFGTHPYLSRLGAKTREGDFWDVRPVEKSMIDRASHLSLYHIINTMMRTKRRHENVK
ncbi:hypothetical protein SSX86_023144 [Deinandra increscens subsp. villosa]|uniref:Uncharacterized protein n=1 Tax=Deinandra increscens subsp. villosa TaxID=3103831 RepID=A0AAP0GPN3_9ASTR